MRHPLRLFAVLLLLTTAIVGGTRSADANDTKLMRWDMAHLSDAPPSVVGGGTNMAADPDTGETIELTGTGQAEPANEEAAGGGTFTHKEADGSTVASGIYVVTSFRDFEKVAGSLSGVPITDAVGEKSEARSGILELGVKLITEDGSVAGRATLILHCSLPGAPEGSVEGSELLVHDGPQFTELAEHSITVFHNLD